ncbi:uncharacterized protein MONOS_14192 [Monocercomonoides exilis]|uniref:uncharacterized protein n=1 Tax=Monocercomonoides exilis TaxID=2049356 RepID=UPI003559621F|nr:hypothetical protein MONOS_14192 [Monocercomonoides exilis]|eukprot:MONOS_14192.1-p1 / transcript=MONOS_14192.1 / gene=MONOS_14192 / organism=Monocercomonoides_exilis_PA203 / gene_product=unspecified product / transcript_product=unspecified product / location=Mono_scaffold00953:3104-10353(+) / protein_length=2377 / sequence_SO=supercontig / SO=protein_coding / is_pseudo=false
MQVPLKPERQNITDNGANTFIWCEWNGSKTTGSGRDYTDCTSNGGAIFMNNLESGELSVSHCSFNDCYAHYAGGGILCRSIESIEIINNTFNSCIAQSWAGGGMCIRSISSCARVSGCDFQNCKAVNYGGGLHIENFQVSGTGCIGSENGEGESACIFDCGFASCSLSDTYGAAMCIYDFLVQVKIRSIQFVSCSAVREGALYFRPEKAGKPNDGFFCYFLFFHECRCLNNLPYGHDLMFVDIFNDYLNSGIPLKECYTTNTNIQRVGYAYNYAYSNTWSYQHTEKSEWLKNGILYRLVTADGGSTNELCGINESNACKSIGVAVSQNAIQTSLFVSLMEGNHGNEQETISVGNKMNVVGKGKEASVIGTNSLSLSSTALFSVTSGRLKVLHVGIDHNATRSSSPSVFVMSGDSGELSLEDVVIFSSAAEGGSAISASVFVVALRQLKMSDVEIKNMEVAQPLFSELFMEGSASGESVLSNVTVRNVNRTGGNGVVMAKSVQEGETFVVQNISIENCLCEEGSGGGICVCLAGDGEVVVNGACAIDGCEAVNVEGKGGRGGGLFVEMESEGCGLTIGQNVEFSKVKENVASYGKDVFVSCSSGILLESKVNTNTFEFFDSTSTPSDVLRLSGSEDGKEDEVIPLFVYLCSIGSKLIVDGSEEGSLNHGYCGFEKFGCLTIDYCANNRVDSSIHEIEVVSSSSIKGEMQVTSFEVSISGKATSAKEEGMRVEVSDEGEKNRNYLIECTRPFEMNRLLFALNEEMNGRRSVFIHSSSSTITITSCSVSFTDNLLIDGMIEFNVINIDGGTLIVNGFVMEGPVTMNGKSPITMTNGMELEILNSRVSEVEVTCGNGGGCLNFEIKEGGSTKIEECNLSSVCSGGNGIKGGGIMISVGNGGSLEMKNVKFDGCEVPSIDKEEGGRGIGGGMFVRFAEEMGSTVLEGMIFEGCNAWKGKKMFISGWDLSEIVNKEKFKWEMSSEELGSLDELCGWERKTTGEERYVIPLVVYLWRNWSRNGFVSKEKGGDFSGCGYSEAPCSSIDHLVSLRYATLETEESKIIVSGSGLLRSSISFSSSSSSSSNTPVVKVEGEEKGRILRVSEMDAEGDEESMIASDIHLSFENLSFNLPSELGKHSSLIHSGSSPSSSATLSIMSCLFVCEDQLRETKYCVLKACRGCIVIEECVLSQFTLEKGFLEFTPEVEVIDVVNTTLTNTSISGRSLISLEEETQSNRLSERGIRNTKTMIRMNNSTFTNITSEENRVCVVCVDSFSVGVECVMEGCVLTKCTSMRSEEGGGVKMCLKSGESDLKVSGCSFVMCECSTGFGRGGGMMIDALDPNVEANPKTAPPLRLKMENIRFVMNEAFVGKDVFINCFSIAEQVNETLFVLDFNQDALKSNNSICGRDDVDKVDVDLIPLITFYYSAQVFLSVYGNDNRQCGAQSNPCRSVSCSVKHIEKNLMNVLWIDGECVIGGECEIGDVRMNSMMRTPATIQFNKEIEEIGNERSVAVFVNECIVEKCRFVFGEMFEGNQESILKEKNGRLEISVCIFSSLAMDLVMKNTIVSVESGELKMSETSFSGIRSTVSLLSFCSEGRVEMFEISISNIECEGDSIVVGGKAEVEMKEITANNISLMKGGSAMKIEGAEEDVSVLNCSFEKCTNSKEKGNMIQIREGRAVRIEACAFDGEGNGEWKRKRNGKMNRKEICGWNGSLITGENSNVEMRETTIKNSRNGGIWISGGSLNIEKGEFENNNPSIEGYPSLRRNVICTGNGELNVVSVKGGDGWERNTSLWMLNEGCSFEGIVSERDSSFFIPVLESVEAIEETERMKLKFKGFLLIPCNLSFSAVKRKGEEKEIEHYDFDSNGFLSEREVEGSVAKDLISSCGDEIEVSVHVLFGRSESPSSTNSIILKNKSEIEQKGDERIAEGGKKEKTFWPIIVIVLVMILLIVLIVSIIVTVRWRRAKNENKDLRELMNDSVKKDPKLIEMVTMEMSPEEQWRRAEREAEKKNEENMKKRAYDKTLGHSESSEHLLSESGSTEYILGKDSDKIPEWMLEKVDEEEETRKRTPSPSVTSTSTTDSDSTFVRGEDLCPTTSSMSNLVDAMACSSPHEKLIVDLRDSLFMLLHGRNEKKEMAIGSLQEREVTAAQVLFWVANGAIHSFDEMENPLQSLSSLSPHIVLFSEHMVICIVMHSDLLSDDDSDSSSISSSTVITSASDDGDDESDSLPSSAFEEEDSFKKECLRWKAPELQMNKKMEATKESVAFSIGMMLWECLSLKIPFGEYDAEIAGQKISNGERPSLECVSESRLHNLVLSCLSQKVESRPTLLDVKKELFGMYGKGGWVMTMTDAMDVVPVRINNGSGRMEGSEVSKEILLVEEKKE